MKKIILFLAFLSGPAAAQQLGVDCALTNDCHASPCAAMPGTCPNPEYPTYTQNYPAAVYSVPSPSSLGLLVLGLLGLTIWGKR